MLEIIALIWLSRDIGKLAKSKGFKASTWQIYLVLGWILAEFIGVVIGFMIFGQHNIVSVLLVGIGFAFISYFSLRSKLNKYPDSYDDDIDHIGNSQ